MVIYSSRNAPKLKTKAVIFEPDGKTVKRAVPVHFKHGVFETDDKDVIAALDKMIATSPNFSQLVMKIDRDAAERVSREWQKHQASQQMVARGGTNSEDANLARRAEQIRNEVISEGKTPEEADKLIKELSLEGLMLADKVDPAVTSPKEGFVPNAEGKTGEGDPTAVIPEATEAQAKSAQEIAGAPSMRGGNPFANARQKD